MAMVFQVKQAVLESGRLYFSKSYWLSEVRKEAPSKPEYSLEYQHKNLACPARHESDTNNTDQYRMRQIYVTSLSRFIE